MKKSEIIWGFIISVVGGILVLYYQNIAFTPPLQPKIEDVLSKRDSLSRINTPKIQDVLSIQDSLNQLRNKDLEYYQIQKEEIRLNQAIISARESIISNKFDEANSKINQIIWILDLKYHSKGDYLNKYVVLKNELEILYNRAFSLAQKVNKKENIESISLEEDGKGIYTFPDESRLVCKYVTDDYTEVDFFHSDEDEKSTLGAKILIGQERVFRDLNSREYSVLYTKREGSRIARFRIKYKNQ